MGRGGERVDEISKHVGGELSHVLKLVSCRDVVGVVYAIATSDDPYRRQKREGPGLAAVVYPVA